MKFNAFERAGVATLRHDDSDYYDETTAEAAKEAAAAIAASPPQVIASRLFSASWTELNAGQKLVKKEDLKKKL